MQVTYNLITFRTDIIQYVVASTCNPDQHCGFVYLPDICPLNQTADDTHCNIGLASAMMPFMLVTCASFCVGFVTVLVAMTLHLCDAAAVGSPPVVQVVVDVLGVTITMLIASAILGGIDQREANAPAELGA